jgi:hypothetical protein
VSDSPPAVVDRPLGLGEIFAETVRLYGERAAASLGVGGVLAAAIAVALKAPAVVDLVLLPAVFTACHAVAARLVRGDGFGEAWANVAVRALVLLPLAGLVWLPILVVLRFLGVLGLVPFAAWLALVGFSIPVAMVESGGTRRALAGALALARNEYLHAVGVASALVVANLLVSLVLAGLLASFADNGGIAATALAQLVLAPFFFLGLGVLYFEHRARAISSRGRS